MILILIESYRAAAILSKAKLIKNRKYLVILLGPAAKLSGFLKYNTISWPGNINVNRCIEYIFKLLEDDEKITIYVGDETFNELSFCIINRIKSRTLKIILISHLSHYGQKFIYENRLLSIYKKYLLLIRIFIIRVKFFFLNNNNHYIFPINSALKIKFIRFNNYAKGHLIPVDYTKIFKYSPSFDIFDESCNVKNIVILLPLISSDLSKNYIHDIDDIIYCLNLNFNQLCKIKVKLHPRSEILEENEIIKTRIIKNIIRIDQNIPLEFINLSSSAVFSLRTTFQPINVGAYYSLSKYYGLSSSVDGIFNIRYLDIENTKKEFIKILFK